MNSHDPAWSCRKVHTLPVGRCTCAHSPALAASSSTDALCISDVLAGRRLAVLVFEPMGVPMTGTISLLSHARGHQPQTWGHFNDTAAPPAVQGGGAARTWAAQARAFTSGIAACGGASAQSAVGSMSVVAVTFSGSCHGHLHRFEHQHG